MSHKLAALSLYHRTIDWDGEMLEDPLFWILVVPGLLLGVYAQWRIKINFAKYSQVGTQDGITGAEVARRLLNSKGLRNVAVESTPGILKDHYDPRAKTVQDLTLAEHLAGFFV